MSLRDAQQRLAAVARECKAAKVIASLTGDDAAVFAEWVAEGRTSGWIWSILQAEGHEISDGVLRRHMNGTCVCPSSSAPVDAHRDPA